MWSIFVSNGSVLT